MKPKLPRELLWTEIRTIDRFLEEPVNREMYDLILLAKDNISQLLDYESVVLKVFNEVYYQCTRIEYEADPDVRIGDMKSDIKANLGLLHYARVVYYFIYFLLSHRSNNSRIAEQYKKAFRRQVSRYIDVYGVDTYNRMMNTTKYHIDLTPQPVPAKELKGSFLDWETITNTYDKESIIAIKNLYDDHNDKKEVMDIIENNFSRFIGINNIKLLKLLYPNIADSSFFFVQHDEEENEGNQGCLMCAEELEEAPTYSQLQEENEMLRKKLDEALSENESLKSALNMNKPKKQQETSFTLKLIVDYCKKVPEYTHVTQIEKMLYKFIRKCTDKDEKLVDSISEYFNSRKYGVTYIKEQTIMPNVGNYKPEIQTQTMNVPLPTVEQDEQNLLEDE